MVVVVIIAILAVIAVPLFSARFRQARVQQQAHTVAEVYRGARTRALGRGASIVVTFDPGSGPGTATLQVLEGVEGDTAGATAERAQCGNLPTRGCLTNNWGNLGSAGSIGTARLLSNITVDAGVSTTALVGTSAVSGGNPMSVCFSPGGRAYVDTAGTFTPASWAALNTVVTIGVTGANRTYDVLVLPNGTARLAL